MSLLKTENFEPREYQKSIAETASKTNTLVVLPTGIGKTLVAVLVAVKRLEEYSDSKILITAPTRPLNAQHKKSFEKFTTIDPEEIILVTGKIAPQDRTELYKRGRVVIATPQTIENDLGTGKLNLEDFSFIVFDEAHRCVKEYAYTYVAKKYMEQSKHPLILGLTASPGGTIERINEIRKNLFIESVEIRSEYDGDVEPYVKEIARDWVYVELPEEFKKIKTLVEESLKENIFWLRDHHMIQTLKPSKKLLLMLQNRIMSRYMQGSKNYAMMWVVMKTAESIKLEHALELLETQNISSLLDYLKKFEKSKKKTDQRIFKDPRIREAIKLVEELKEKNIEHPKLNRLLEIVKTEIEKNPSVKIIVFANYRDTVDKINELMKNNNIKSEILIGQAIKKGKGLTQQQQIEILKNFMEGMFNVLPTSSIGEEGIDYHADIAIFYDAVPSEIRVLQRRGRVGRQKVGKVIYLITKATRDETYFWSAIHKEKKMKGILYDLKKRGVKIKKKETLKDWVK